MLSMYPENPLAGSWAMRTIPAMCCPLTMFASIVASFVPVRFPGTYEATIDANIVNTRDVLPVDDVRVDRCFIRAGKPYRISHCQARLEDGICLVRVGIEFKHLFPCQERVRKN